MGVRGGGGAATVMMMVVVAVAVAALARRYLKSLYSQPHAMLHMGSIVGPH